MQQKKPRVSLGLPVYNGENYLAEALDAMLAQTFEDFELIISDNASTDATPEICKAYAQRDARIRYLRNDSNVGATRNFNLLVEHAEGPYFKWMAHDDLHAPEYLEKCVAVLDANPSVVLCYTRWGDLSADGKSVEPRDFEIRSDDASPHIRFHDWVHRYHQCTAVFGVIRKDVLEKTAMIGAYAASDRNLLAELALHGPSYEVPELLFFRRQHPSRSMKTYENERDRLVWFDPQRARKHRFHFPTFRRGVEYLAAITRAPIPMSERLLCYQQVFSLAMRGSVRRRLVGDLTGARMQRTG